MTNPSQNLKNKTKGKKIIGKDFINCSFENSIYEDCVFLDCTFTNCSVTSGLFIKTKFIHCEFKDSRMDHTFYGLCSKFENCTLNDRALPIKQEPIFTN